jgi:hypothetical protein
MGRRIETDTCCPQCPMGWRIGTDECCTMGWRIKTNAFYPIGWRIETDTSYPMGRRMETDSLHPIYLNNFLDADLNIFVFPTLFVSLHFETRMLRNMWCFVQWMYHHVDHNDTCHVYHVMFQDLGHFALDSSRYAWAMGPFVAASSFMFNRSTSSATWGSRIPPAGEYRNNPGAF